MATQTVEALIQGGKATAAPPLGPALGPLGVNIGQVIGEINKKTKDFNGMQVPIKVIVDEDKSFTITVGTPPASALVKKEAGIQKASGSAKTDKVADLRIEQIIKVAKMKEDALLGNDLFGKVKEIIGSCVSMGILVEGMDAKEAIKAVNDGKFDSQIKAEKTELTAEELKALEAERKRLQEDLEKRKKELTAKAKAIIEQMSGKSRSAIKNKLVEAQIPHAIMEELLPQVDQAAKGAAAPAKKK